MATSASTTAGHCLHCDEYIEVQTAESLSDLRCPNCESEVWFLISTVGTQTVIRFLPSKVLANAEGPYEKQLINSLRKYKNAVFVLDDIPAALVFHHYAACGPLTTKTLIAAHKHFSKQTGSFKIVVDSLTAESLHITKLDSVFDVHTSLAAALD